MHDGRLLREFVRFGSEDAFAELVKRHERLVYSAALREVGNPQAAEDVTQAVFLILAQKAPALWNHEALAGWLFHTARLAGKSALRQERRRRQREHAAAAQALAATPAYAPPDTMRVNEALSALRPHEREAILLRFFSEASFSEVGAALGVSEDTAQKRVSRALDKMRTYLVKSGAPALSVAAVTGLLSAEAARNVPSGCCAGVLHVLPGLKITLGTCALFGSPAHHISQGVLRMMKAKSVFKATAIGAVACLSISAIWAGSVPKPNGSIAGTWDCQVLQVYVRNHSTRTYRTNMHMTYNPNGTFTGKLVSMTGMPSVTGTGNVVITGRYTLKVLKKTGHSTSARLSTTITQETKYGKVVPLPQSAPPVTITLSDNGKTMIIEDRNAISSQSGNVINVIKVGRQVWHRQ